jgi:hypothetical protein
MGELRVREYCMLVGVFWRVGRREVGGHGMESEVGLKMDWKSSHHYKPPHWVDSQTSPLLS